jgi:hypothetical protein
MSLPANIASSYENFELFVFFVKFAVKDLPALEISWKQLLQKQLAHQL